MDIRGVAVLLALATSTPASADPRSGEYVCAYGCRATDANPTLQIDGDVARCVNEIGGLFMGRVLAGGAVACFRNTGVWRLTA
jgi:hypothetical protein